MKNFAFALSALLLLPGTLRAGDAPPSIYTFKSLSVETASKAAWEAIIHAYPVVTQSK